MHDLPAQLRGELDRMLDWIIGGDFMDRHVPAEARHLMDLAFSGNGEPTSAAEFPAAVAIAVAAIERHQLCGVALRLISNGSLVERPRVRAGLASLAAAGASWVRGAKSDEVELEVVASALSVD